MDLKIFENGTYTQDDILEWHETFGTKEYQNSLKNLQEDQFDNIFKHQDENSIYTIGEKNGVTVILNTEPIPTLFGTNMDDLAAAGESTKKKIFDVAAATPGFLKDAFNPVNIGKGLNTAVVNFFDFIDNSTGGAVTTLDNFFVENFPNTLGKKFEYEEPQTPGGVTGKIIGQYVLTDLFLRRVIPFFRKNTATGIAADGTTVGLFSSKDESNLVVALGEMFPNFTNNNQIAKTIVQGLTANEDDSEVLGRLKNVISDTGALAVVMGLFKVMKSFNKNPEKVEEYVEAQSAGAAATPKEAPTPVEVVDSSGQVIKQADELVTSEKPFYSNVENAISNFKFKQQPGNQILATLNNTAGIKQSEIQDLGLDTFLKDKPNVTKQELDDFIADNSLITKVKDEILEGSEFANSKSDLFIPTDERVLKIPKELLDANSYDDAKLIVMNNQKIYNKFVEFANKELGFSGDDIDNFQGNALDEFLEKRYGITQLMPGEMVKPAMFESYVTPGGENYKEMLITVPGSPQVYTKHHYRGSVDAGENLIAHARFNDRTIDGNKILFIEEIQSDLHQAGRKKGYNTKDSQAARSEFDRYSLFLADKYDLNPGQNLAMYGTMKKMSVEEINKYNDLQAKVNFDGIADAPFKKNWYELTMKRLIKYAVDNGYDGIALTTGDMQAARYAGQDNLKVFYDNTLVKFTNKYAKKFDGKLEEGSINASIEDPNLIQINKKYRTNSGDVYEITKGKLPTGGESEQYVIVKQQLNNDGSTDIFPISRSESIQEIKNILINELKGFDTDLKVPMLIFPQNMKNEILTEGVPIAQVEEKENKQQTSAVV